MNGNELKPQFNYIEILKSVLRFWQTGLPSLTNDKIMSTLTVSNKVFMSGTV